MIFLLIACSANNNKLIEISRIDDYPSFKKLDLSNENLTTRDSKGNAAIHYAIANRNVEMVKSLITTNTKLLDITNHVGKTVIDLALENRWLIELLVDIGVSMVLRNNAFMRKKHRVKDGRMLSISEIAHLTE